MADNSLSVPVSISVSESVKKPFWSWAHSEADGSPSFARTWTAIITSFVLGWDSAYMFLVWQWNSHHLAVGQAPMAFLPDATTLAAQAGLIGVLYGANKFTTGRRD